MNILLLVNKVPYPPNDGGARATLNLIKGLSHLGYHPDVLAMNTSKHPSLIEDFPEDIIGMANFTLIPVDTRISWFGFLKNLLFSSLPYNLERFHSESFTRTLERVLRKNEYPIIQLEGLALAHYISVIRNNSAAKIVMRAHNVEYRVWERIVARQGLGLHKKYLSILAGRIKAYEIRNLSYYDALIPISSEDEKIFRSHGYTNPGFLAPFGLEPSFFHGKILEPVSSSLFYIGALDWIPNQEGLTWFLSEVWTKIRAKIPDLTFHVAGRNAPPRMVAYLQQEGIDFKGEVPDAREFIEPKSIMVVPLFSGSGIRVKIIEGMGLGKTVITTSVGAEGINGTNGYHFVIADTAETFTNSLLELLGKPELQRKFGENARQFVKENFNNLVISQNLDGFYKSILK
ncbi:MAG: glycosyltransferase [Bacteroidales bacterium]|nr:MAG: glycosyltransferase [Bacteroidales bacterium]